MNCTTIKKGIIDRLKKGAEEDHIIEAEVCAALREEHADPIIPGTPDYHRVWTKLVASGAARHVGRGRYDFASKGERKPQEVPWG